MKPPKLSLRVSGSRIGSVARPLDDGAVAIAPSKRLGLKIHTSSLVPAPATAAGALDVNDYATLDDYKDVP